MRRSASCEVSVCGSAGVREEEVRGSAHDCSRVVCGSGVSDEGTRESGGSGRRSAVSGQRSAGSVERGGWSYRSTKALVNGRFSNLYRTSVRPPADPRRPHIPLTFLWSLLARPCSHVSIPLPVNRSVSQSVKPTSALLAPPHHRPLQVSAQARGVPSIAPSIPWPSQKAKTLVL